MRTIARYIGVGAVAAAVDISLFGLFAGYLGFNYLLVGLATFVLATALNYSMSIRYVFVSGVRFARNEEILLVFAISFVGLILNQLALYVGIELLQMRIIVSKLVATGAVFAWNYTARSRFVFNHQR